MAPVPSQPGIVGRLVRLAPGGMIGWFMAHPALVDAPAFWTGFGGPAHLVPLLVPLVVFSSWFVNGLLQREWGIRPALVLGVCAVLAGAWGMATQGDFLGPPVGVYVWAWAFAFSWLLAPAFILAAFLGTPGCEMRAYLHLWTIVRRGDVTTVMCPGWIDRVDDVRLFGRY